MREKYPGSGGDPADHVVQLGTRRGEANSALRLREIAEESNGSVAKEIPTTAASSDVELTAGWTADDGRRSVSKPRLGGGGSGSNGSPSGGIFDLFEAGREFFAPSENHHHHHHARPTEALHPRHTHRHSNHHHALHARGHSPATETEDKDAQPREERTAMVSREAKPEAEPPPAEEEEADAKTEPEPSPYDYHSSRSRGHRQAASPYRSRLRQGSRSKLQDKLNELRSAFNPQMTPPPPPRHTHSPVPKPQRAPSYGVRSDRYVPPSAPGSTTRKPRVASRAKDSRQSGSSTSRREPSPARESSPSRSVVARESEPDTAQGRQEPTPAQAESAPQELRSPDVKVARQLDPLRKGGQAKGRDVLLSLDGPQLTAKASGPRRIVVSREAEFSVTIRNSGDVEANDVVVTIKLPPWVDVSGTSASRGQAQLPGGEDADSQPLQWRISRLEPSSEETLKMKLIPRRSQPLDLAVHWTYAHAGSNTRVEVEEPLLHMVISGPSEAIYGEKKLYNLTISNPGTGDAHNVVVSLLPLDDKHEAVATSNLGTIRHGETKTIQIELAAGKAGTLLVKAKAAADGGLAADATKEVLVRRADLTVNAAAPEAQYAGNVAHYLLKVANAGNATAEEVTVTAVMPPGASFVDCDQDGHWMQKQGRIRWDVGSLSAGEGRTLKLSCILSTPGENRLRVTAQDKTDLMAVAGSLTRVIARADLKLRVTDPQGPVPVGDEAVYELRIRNRGTETAQGIEAVVFFSEGIEPFAVEGSDHEIGRGQVVFRPIKEIAAGDEIVLKVKAKAQRPGNHIFRTEVLCRSLGTKLAAEETTHFYGKEIRPVAGKPKARTAAAPNRKTPAPAPIDTPDPRKSSTGDPAPLLED